MTFTEAALAVLEREGRPMQVKEISEKALAWNLLSHVGKTPVQTMSTQISAAVAKGPEKSPFVRVKPGVFSLASWGGKAPGPSKQPLPVKPQQPVKQPSPAKQPQAAKQGPSSKPTPTPEEGLAPRQEAAAQGERDEPSGRKRRRRRRKKRSGEESSATPPLVAEEAQGKEPRLEPPRPAPQKPAPHPAPKPAPAPQEAKPARPRENGGDEQDLADRIEAFLRGQNRPASVEAIAEHLGFRGRAGRLLL
jgi:hypothetical protein